MNLSKYQQNLPKSEQSGFTIIECLMAIIVVSILMVGIAPMIVLSVATRVQAKRVELGTNAAKTYIDGVRSGAIPAPPISSTLLKNINPPADATSCQTSTGGVKAFPCGSGLYCIDNDNTAGCQSDSPRDMIVQGAGYHPTLTTAVPSYQLGVRVYRADAFRDSTPLKKSDSTTRSRAMVVAGGMGDRKAPLIELTTEIVTNQRNYTDLCRRLNPTGTCN